MTRPFRALPHVQNTHDENEGTTGGIGLSFGPLPGINANETSAISWKSGVTGNWGTAADWSGGVVPKAGDIVTVGAAGTYTVTISSTEAAAFVTLSNAGAKLSDNALISLSGGLAVTAGTYSLNSTGVVQGGTITVGPAGIFTSLGGTLSGVSYDGTLNLSAANASLHLTGTDSFAASLGTGNGTINLTGTNAKLFAADTTTLNGATINFGVTNGNDTIFLYSATSANDTLTLGPTAIINQIASGANDIIDLYSDTQGGTLINGGTIIAAASGGDFEIYNDVSQTGIFSNQGSIGVSNGDIFLLSGVTNFTNSGNITITGAGAQAIFSGNWSNTGLISVSAGATLSLGGAFSTTSLVGISNASGTIDIAGALLNIGGVFAAATGDTLTSTGTITGGTIMDAAGALSVQNGTLSAVTYFGTLSLASANAKSTLANGFNTTSGISAALIGVTGSGSELIVDDTQSIDNAIIDLGGSAGKGELYFQTDTGAAGSFTLGAHVNVTATGKNGLISFNPYGYGDDLINNGTITAGISGSTLEIYGGGIGSGVFTDNGILTAANNATLFFVSTTLNFGSLGGINTSGGGAIVLQDSTIANAGSTLTLGTAHQLTLGDGSAINGGTIIDAGNGLLYQAGALIGVTYLGTLNLAAANSSTTIENGLQISSGGGAGVINITGSGAYLYIDNNQTLDNATVNLGSSAYMSELYFYTDTFTQGTFTLGANLSIAGAANLGIIEFNVINAGDQLINNGTITASSSGGTLQIQGDFTSGTFTNNGTLNASNGSTLLIANTSFSAGGLGYFATAGGGELLLQNVMINDTGAIINAGVGHQLTLGAGAAIIGGSVFDSGGGIVANGGTFSAVTYVGTLNLGSSTADLTLTNGLNAAAAAGATINVSGGAALLVKDTQLLNNAVINLSSATSGAALIFSTDTGSAGNLTFGANLSIGSSGALAEILFDTTAYGTGAQGDRLINAGTLSAASASGTLMLEDGRGVGYFTNTGTLSAANSAILSLAGISNFSNLAMGTLTGGVYTATNGGTLLLNNDAALNSDAAVITLNGANSTLAWHNTQTNAQATIDQSLQNITASGTLQILGGRNFVAGQALTDSGLLQLGAAAFTDGSGLTIAASGVVSGYGTLAGMVSDYGTIVAAGGTLLLIGSVGGTGALQAASGSSADLSGGGTLNESITGAGTLQLDGTAGFFLSGQTLSVATAKIDNGAMLTGAGTILGSISDSGGLIASGGTLLIEGALSGAGALTANVGAVLDLFGGGMLSETIAGGGTLQLDSTAYTLGGAALNAGTVQIDAGATLSGMGTVAGALNNTGVLAVAGGTLTIAGAFLDRGAASIAANATLDVAGGGAISNIAGAGTLQLDGTAALALTGGTLSVAYVKVDADASLSAIGTISSLVSNAGTVIVSGGTLSLTGGMIGTGALIANLGAVLDLTAGGTLSESISGAGTLQLDSEAYILGAASVGTALVRLDAGATLSGAGSISGALMDNGSIALSTGRLTIGGMIAGAGNIAASAGATVALAGGGSVSGAISGAGTLQLDGVSAYTLTGAALAIAHVNVDAGATLNISGTIGGALTDNGTIIATANALTLTTSLAGSGALIVNAGTVADFTVGGSVTVNISGAGTLQLDGTVPFIAQNPALSIANVVIDAGAIFDLSGGGALTQAFSGGGALQLSGGNYILQASALRTAAVQIAADATLSGMGTIFGNVVNAGQVTVTSATLAIAGSISGAGTFAIAAGATVDFAGGGGLAAVYGAGTLQLDGAAAYSLSGGSLVAANLNVDAGATLAGSGFITGILTNYGTITASNATLTVAGAVLGTGALSVAAGAILDLTAGSALTQVTEGAGTLQLDGATQFSIQGAVLGAAYLNVDTGATLAGSGTINGDVLNNGAIIASAGTMTIAGAIGGAGTFSVEAGAILDLAGGGTITPRITGGGILQLDNASFTLGAAPVQVATVLLDAGATLDGPGIISGNLINNGAVAINAGTLTIEGTIGGAGPMIAAAATTIDLAGGGTLASITGAGTLQLDNSNFALGGRVSIANILIDAGAALTGAGTIAGTLVNDGSVTIGGGPLIIDGAISGTGAISIGSLSTVDLLGGGTLAGAISGAGLLQLDNAAYTLAGIILSNATTRVDAGATLTGTGTFTNALIDGGSVVANGGALNFLGAITGGGALVAAAGASLVLDAGGALSETISGAGGLVLQGSVGYMLTGQTDSIAGVLLAAGSALSGYGTLIGAISDAGIISAAGGTLVLAGVVSGAGLLQAAAGALLDLASGGALNTNVAGAGTLEIGGAFSLGAGTLSVANLLIASGGGLSGAGTLTAVVNDLGSLNAAGGTLTIATALTGNGTLSASAGATLVLADGGSFSGALSGAGLIDIASAFALAKGASIFRADLNVSANVTLGAGAALSEAVGSTLNIEAAAHKTVKLSGPASSSFTNGGLLLAYGGGTAEIATSFVNTGTVQLASGTLSFLGTASNAGSIEANSGLLSFKKDVTGTGTLQIGATGTLSLLAGAASGETVDFLAGSGLLELTKPSAFGGTIANFGAADLIDLLKAAETSFTYAGGVLTVKDGTKTEATLHFSGNYTQSEFSLASDGHGGTFIAL